MVTVTGDNPAVAAIVAINFAAIAADEARSTLLIDTDGVSSSVTAALRLRTSAGISGLAKGTAEWPEVTRSARLGRDRTIDVVPSGEGGLPIDEIKALLQKDMSRLSKRYDAIILVSSLEQVLGGLPTALPIPDVLFCARTGTTTVSDAKRTISEIAATGAHPRGIVLWDAIDPEVAQLRPVEEVERETPEVPVVA
jgi:Mrp family chromosome partitioning ATPase